MAPNMRKKSAVNSRSKRQKVSRPKTDGFFKVHFKQARGSLTALWERPLGNILTLAVISMALALPACLYLMGKNIAYVTNQVATTSQVSVFLTEQLPEARAMVMKDEIESWPLVDAVEYVSSQQGLADLSDHTGFDEAIGLLDGYALPGVFVITPSVEDTVTVKNIVSQLTAMEGISDIRIDEDWLTRLNAIRSLMNGVITVLSSLMLSSVFLIVGNTLRFNVLANKEEIQTMKLIGATDQFILRPYLYSGMWFGLLGSVTAWVFTALITVIFNSAVENLATLYDSQYRLLGLNWDESLLLLMLGTFIGCLAAKLSAQRHLKDIEPV
ncbi:permease-like cell division protein FtsX [Vibrio sp. FNV 38]|nr:permease-like cell division protein FtsX [Vibrio sp. FNV 38]